MITGFIEELFHDNISVQGLNLKGDTEYKKQMVTLCETEKYLSESLKGKYLKVFSRFSESWNFINAETNKVFFMEGFKLGADCMHDVFCGGNKSN